MQRIPTEDQDEVFQIDSGSFESDHAMECYQDEDNNDNNNSDGDNDSGRFDNEEANAAITSGRRMKSMGIMMGDDFLDEENRRNGTCCGCGRYWYLWLCCTVVAVTMLITFQAALQYRKDAYLFAGYMSKVDDSAECRVYDDQTLDILEKHFEAHNGSESEFCQADFPDCACKHPFQATKPTGYGPQWTEIQTMNLAQVEKFEKHQHADVAILGDSIVEHFTGLDLGYTGGAWKANKRAFDKVFDRSNGGKVNGVALGIGGDRIQNLLYRIQNGEAPVEFHPNVWWILIGTNDLEDKCNADTIVVGHFRLVEEIRKYHPGAIIVLNSILPRNENPDDLTQSPTWPVIQEINLKLECYTNTARGVEFFNATDIFTGHHKGKTVVNSQFMKDAVHPNAEGSRLWGDAIADRVIELKQLKRHHDKKNKKHGNHDHE